MQALLYSGMIGRTGASTTGMGIVIWFDPKHGYGFIKPDGGGPDLFVRAFVSGTSVLTHAARGPQ
ncbi:cold-shock protein [Bradyrhizobium cenepequi]|uniref:cold-shock protein n=1 Tax=Bradyrhizobium cenepequi TaxID=2821403 RepID=UPI001CE2DB18|nr:cold shock domain-containing protein [Bradyrhizobium cenepequi]MCA6113005.1 cold shock domain-containing protein [Bradyrhizobium cenepequi]